MAMDKLIVPDSQDFGESRIVPVSSRGLRGHDLNAFIKRAGHVFADFVRGADLKPGDVPIHLIAMGATEYFGPNRNGDGFKEANLKKYHHTFVKHAKFYRDHLNKDRAKSYGYVKMSLYNDAMHRVELLPILNGTKEAADRNGGFVADRELEKLASSPDNFGVSMACVLNPASPVLTDKGYKRIDAIVAGDLVHTHAGRWQAVTEINRRVYSGEVVDIYLEGLAVPLELTADHPMYAKVLAAYPALKQSQRPVAQWAAEVSSGDEPFDWVQAGHLQKDDRIDVRPVLKVPGVPAIGDRRFAELLGIYAAEGSLAYNGDNPSTVTLTVHSDDWAVRSVPAIIESLWDGVTVELRPKTNSKVSLSLNIFSSELARWISELVGTSFREKRIPMGLFNSTEECKLAFLGRWLDGDGFCDGKGIHWSSGNFNLILQGRDLLLSLGVAASIYKIDHSKCETSGYANSGIEYTLNVSNFDASILRGFSEKVGESPFLKEGPRAKPPCLYGVGESYAYRVKRVERREVVDAQTYNFEVEGDHSYSLMGTSSHNCRIPFDVCSGCQNRAKTRDEYCTEMTCKYGGLKTNITKVAADGHMLHADNPDPSFFDISHVYRPADRIAWVLGRVKQAGHGSAAQHRIKGGAELAFLAGVGAPPEFLTAGMNARAAVFVKLAAALSDMEEAFRLNPLDAMTGAYAFKRELQPSAIDVPLQCKYASSAGQVWRTLAEHRVLLPVGPYLCLTLGEEKAAQLVERVGERLPGVFGRLLLREDMESLIDNNPAAVGRSSSPEVEKWAMSKVACYGVGEKHHAGRVMTAALRGLAPPKLAGHGNSGPDDGAERAAIGYALYKLAFLAHWSAGPEAGRLSRLAVQQNYVRG